MIVFCSWGELEKASNHLQAPEATSWILHKNTVAVTQDFLGSSLTFAILTKNLD